MSRIFDTDRRIRLGIWGLGRGMSFYETCEALNFDVVAGCDFSEDLRNEFAARNPGALVTADADEFLAADFDAVLVATYAITHADDAIRALRAGKHVLSEVPAFFTPEEGVRLVETVEETGLVYQLAENYPHTPVNRYLARKWREGLFGSLVYAEFAYLHDTRHLAYTYLNGKPVQPGNTMHSWRSWMNAHYYCTHSLGPVMVITGARPTRVVALPGKNPVPGLVRGGKGTIAAQLISMSGGGVFRNLMGSTTDEGSAHRLIGTKGSADVNKGLWLRLGGGGNSPKVLVEPDMDELDRRAHNTGHGGGDFWVLYYFAREILTGEKGPFDVYGAADVTLPGILAYRSANEDGAPKDVPDFRNKEERDRYRRDSRRQQPYDIRSLFPASADYAITGDFTDVMRQMCHYAKQVRAFLDWGRVESQVVDKEFYLDRVVEPLLSDIENAAVQYARARRIADAYPDSDGARVIREMLEHGAEDEMASGRLKAALEAKAEELRAKKGAARTYLTPYAVSPVLPKPGRFDATPYPDGSVTFSDPFHPAGAALDLRDHHGYQDGVVYARARYSAGNGGRGRILVETGNPFKLWVNGQFVAGAAKPASDGYEVSWRPGENEVMVALDTIGGTGRIYTGEFVATMRLRAVRYL